MSTELDLVGLVAGLGLFLYGMRQLEVALEGLAGKTFRQFLREATGNRVSSVIGGALATALVQSSSLVGLIVLAFVGAGILPLVNAIGIVLGSNLGTTLTGWIVTALGFRLDLESIALPLLGCAALGYTLLKDRWQSFCLFLVGIGLLIAGLGFMKTSVAVLATQFDFTVFQDLPLFVFLVAGALLTAAIQSSSATMMITLSALHAGLIELPAAAAMVVGADLGTTTTVIIGSLQGAVAKRRVAMAHFLFNLVVDIVAFIALIPLLYVISNWLRLSDPLYSLVMFHSLFNLLGVLCFLPLLGLFTRLIQHLVPDRPEASASKWIHNVPTDVPDAAIEALRKESCDVLISAARLNIHALGVTRQDLPLSRDASYEQLKALEGEVVTFAIHLQQNPLDEQQAAIVDRYLYVVRRAVLSCKSLRDVAKDMSYFDEYGHENLVTGYREMCQVVSDCCDEVVNLLQGDHDASYLEESCQELRERLHSAHERFDDRIYGIHIGEGITGQDISTMFNTSRELFFSGKALLQAFKKYVVVT